MDKILGEKYRSREMHKERGNTSCLVELTAVGIRRRIAAALQLLYLPKHKQQRKENTINNKNTTGAMHTHDDMTF